MTAAVVERKARPLSGLAHPIDIYWPDRVPVELQRDILKMMNIIIEKENTIGFPKPLTEEEGLALLGELAKSVENGSKRLMLLYRRDTKELVGHLILTRHTLPNCRHIAECSRVFVIPEFRGISSIRQGTCEMLRECTRMGVDVVTLDVRAHTRIHKLWVSIGFETIGIMKDYARVNGESYDGCFMYQQVSILKQRLGMTD